MFEEFKPKSIKKEEVKFSEPEKKEGEEKAQKIPSFLFENQDGLFAGVQEGTDVTQEYKDYLKSIGKYADSLPPFLFYEDSGSIYIESMDDVDLTEEWNSWLKTLKTVEIK